MLSHRRLASSALVAVIVSISAAARSSVRANAASDVPAADRYFALVRERYSGARARDVVAFMERYFRLPGNAGFDASIHHVEALLREAGYIAEASARPGTRLTYRLEHRAMTAPAWEPVDATLSISGEPAALLEFTMGRAPERLPRGSRNMLAINSYSTPDGGTEAEVVAVGKGQPADFEGKEVAGKIVYGEAAIGALFAEAVQKRGAAGVLAYRLPAYTKPEAHRSSIQFSSIPLDSARRSWGILLSYGAKERLDAALAHGTVRAHVTTHATFRRAEELTLIADVRGAVRADERFVFSAHVQEPGANDNASGVGALAEAARVTAALVRDRQVVPARTITFVWGNEIGAIRAYLREDTVRTRGVRWGVSLDMVGEDTKKTGGTFLIEKMPDPSAVWTRGDDRHTEWGGSPLTVDQLRPHYFNDFILRRCLDQASVTDWVVRTNPFEGGSDHVPFLDAKKPGLLFWHFTDEFYHTDGDRLENVSATTLANVGTSALVAALTLTSADGETARAIVAELEAAARDRLAREAALSKAAIDSGGPRDRERTILETWTAWYRDAIRSAADIEVGGSSPETQRAIDDAARRVEALGAELVRGLGG
jgi:aminopeptidase YwaD